MKKPLLPKSARNFATSIEYIIAGVRQECEAKLAALEAAAAEAEAVAAAACAVTDKLQAQTDKAHVLVAKAPELDTAGNREECVVAVAKCEAVVARADAAVAEARARAAEARLRVAEGQLEAVQAQATLAKTVMEAVEKRHGSLPADIRERITAASLITLCDWFRQIYRTSFRSGDNLDWLLAEIRRP